MNNYAKKSKNGKNSNNQDSGINGNVNGDRNTAITKNLKNNQSAFVGQCQKIILNHWAKLPSRSDAKVVDK